MKWLYPDTKRQRQEPAGDRQLIVPTLVECGSCGNKVLLHRGCPKCGFYRVKQEILPESKV